ncbi:MAG: cytochrome C, partial [Salegentibacter sp.]
MKKVKYRHLTSRLLLLSVAFFLLFTVAGYSQQDKNVPDTKVDKNVDAASADAGSELGDPAKGKEIFNSLCAACHKPYQKVIGP